MKRYIRNSECDGYWYHARHGVGPGTIPSDCHLLDVVEDPDNSWKDYFLLDRALTTEELKEFDLKEKCPPQIQASTAVKASKASEFPNRWSQDKGKGNSFFMYYTDPDRFGAFRAYITLVRAYDDADYAYAYVDGHTVEFYNREGLIDTMQLWSYDPEDYAGDVQGYVKDVYDTVCDELIQMNSKVKPVMVHN